MSPVSAVGRVFLIAAVVVPVALWVVGEVYERFDNRRHPPFGDAFEQMDGPITLFLLIALGLALAAVGGIALLVGTLL